MRVLLWMATEVGGGSSAFVLQVVAIAAGGGFIQLLIFLLRRRTELRALDRTSSEPLLERQDALIDRLQKMELAAQGRIAQLEEKLAVQQRDFTSSLATAHRENDRMAAELARLRTDLDIYQRQLEELRRARGLS